MSSRRKRSAPAARAAPTSSVCGIPGWARNEARYIYNMEQIYAKYERMARENPEESFAIVDLEKETIVVREGTVDIQKYGIRVRQFGENVETAADDELEKSGFYKAVRAQYRCQCENGARHDLESCVGPPTAKKRRVSEWRASGCSESAASSRPPDRRLLEDFTNDEQRSLLSGHSSSFGDRPPPQQPHCKLDKTPPKTVTGSSGRMVVSPIQLSRLLDGKISETIQKYINSARRRSGRIKVIQEKNLKYARAELEALCFPNVAVGRREQRRRTQMASPGRLHGLLSKLGFTTTTQHIRLFFRNGVPIAQMMYQLMETERAQTQIFNLESIFSGQKWRPPAWDQRSGIGPLPAAITFKMPTRDVYTEFLMGKESEQRLMGESRPPVPELSVREWRLQWVDSWVSSTTTAPRMAEGVLEEDRFQKGLRRVFARARRTNQLEMSGFLCP